jgi:hypothetical protein
VRSCICKEEGRKEMRRRAAFIYFSLPCPAIPSVALVTNVDDQRYLSSLPSLSKAEKKPPTYEFTLPSPNYAIKDCVIVFSIISCFAVRVCVKKKEEGKARKGSIYTPHPILPHPVLHKEILALNVHGCSAYHHHHQHHHLHYR